MTITPLELHALNFRFLLLLHGEAKRDPAAASRLFGVEQPACEEIAGMSLDAIEELAKTNTLVFRARFDKPTLALLATAGSPGVRAVLVESRCA